MWHLCMVLGLGAGKQRGHTSLLIGVNGGRDAPLHFERDEEAYSTR